MKDINQRPSLFTLLLGFIASLGPLSIDMGLPGISGIESYYHLAPGEGSLTFSVFVAGLAVSPLLGGILSDRYGRKLLIIFSLILYSITALMCSSAQSFDFLLCSRLIQGLSAGLCIAIPIAIIRDTLSGVEAQLRISNMIMLVGIAPLVAPLLGSLLLQFGPWQRIHEFQAAMGLLSALLIALTFSETLPMEQRQGLSAGHILGELGGILAIRIYVFATFVYAMGFCAMFTYVTAASSIFVDGFGFTTDQLAYIMALTSGLAALGSWANAQLTRSGMTANILILAGLSCMTVPPLLLLFIPDVNALLVGTLMALVVLGFGLLSPASNHIAMEVIEQGKGKASGLMRLVQMSAAALVSSLYTLLISMIGGVWSVAILVLSCALIGLICWLYLQPYRQQHNKVQ